ncbi:APC family permease [Virgibacillus halodenitrificans]|uniref:APC family permease n=1 Tax=Virgibacillus halodenitrificans TaxID=1482 RepID=UPI001FB4C008|nr:APC family permease [Virgibacillus halodenitrificans]MCJ0929611.1 APC family permease [Virgibacillus halodenitrificans]WHX26066.1 APC family permease [Virgibacillus halodenitrificans]
MEERTTLEKSLKPHWVWAIALGSSIGWGAFVQPTNWMADAGPLGVIIGFGIGALLMMLIAVSYGFLIKSFPVSGGEFAYAFISLGRKHAFISGWFLTLGYICIVALNASAFALMLKFVFPAVIEQIPLYQIAGWDVYGMEVIVASAALGIFGYFNIRGTGLSGQMQFVFCTIMIISIVVITFMVGGHPGAGLENVQPYFPKDTTAFAAIISIVAIAPWAFVGFDNVPQAAEEFHFSSKKAFTLIILAISIAAVLYSMMIIATAMTQPWQQTVGEGQVWGTAATIQETIGTIGLVLLVTALTMGVFTGLNGFIISSSRLLFAMSRAKILPEAFSKLHPKYNTPHIGIIFTVVVSMFAPWFGREALLWVVDMSSVGVTIAYFYTCYTAFSLFKVKKGEDFNPSKHVLSPMKKSIAAAGMIASLAFLALLLIPGSPAFLGIQSRIALIAWIGLGVIFYMAKRKEFNKIPKEELNYLILGSKKIIAKNRS